MEDTAASTKNDKVDGNEPSQQLWTFPSVDTETANVKQQPGSSGERTCWARAGWEAGAGGAGAGLAFTPCPALLQASQQLFEGQCSPGKGHLSHSCSGLLLP